ncbi:DUF4124 domain-containing protein [Massilia sp. CF038]|uniref:DUF4124 domain-containing protein n=1 Tax=Massilia sp. CF038 TaxID=1881045 RepID=UPI0015B5E2EB|nr:DUF4124 domain-containing protein [Massilia sp. CF038]
MRVPVLTVLILLSTQASAGTLYKCVGADGKITFSDSACQANTRAERRLEVPPPAADSTRAARLQAESERLAEANAEFNKRYAERSKADAEDARRDAERWAARQEAERAAAAARQREQEELDRQAELMVRAARLERCRRSRFGC